MDELACFAPGMLALGSSGYNPGEAEKILSLAEEVILRSICTKSAPVLAVEFALFG